MYFLWAIALIMTALKGNIAEHIFCYNFDEQMNTRVSYSCDIIYIVHTVDLQEYKCINKNSYPYILYLVLKMLRKP